MTTKYFSDSSFSGGCVGYGIIATKGGVVA